jgi:hypothetical protein
MDVSRNTYYAWLHRSPTATEKNDQALFFAEFARRDTRKNL